MNRKLLIASVLLAAIVTGVVIVYQFALTPRDFRVVDEGKLCRSRQPLGWQWHVLKRYGIRTVIDLRPEAEDPAAFAAERKACQDAGAAFVNIPIDRIPPTDAQVAQFLAALRDHPGPALVHCEHGKTRAGLMSAAYRVAVQGWSVDAAVSEMLRLGDKETASIAEEGKSLLEHLRHVSSCPGE